MIPAQDGSLMNSFVKNFAKQFCEKHETASVGIWPWEDVQCFANEFKECQQFCEKLRETDTISNKGVHR